MGFIHYAVIWESCELCVAVTHESNPINLMSDCKTYRISFSLFHYNIMRAFLCVIFDWLSPVVIAASKTYCIGLWSLCDIISQWWRNYLDIVWCYHVQIAWSHQDIVYSKWIKIVYKWRVEVVQYRKLCQYAFTYIISQL